MRIGEAFQEGCKKNGAITRKPWVDHTGFVHALVYWGMDNLMRIKKMYPNKQVDTDERYQPVAADLDADDWVAVKTHIHPMQPMAVGSQSDPGPKGVPGPVGEKSYAGSSSPRLCDDIRVDEKVAFYAGDLAVLDQFKLGLAFADVVDHSRKLCFLNQASELMLQEYLCKKYPHGRYSKNVMRGNQYKRVPPQIFKPLEGHAWNSAENVSHMIEFVMQQALREIEPAVVARVTQLFTEQQEAQPTKKTGPISDTTREEAFQYQEEVAAFEAFLEPNPGMPSWAKFRPILQSAGIHRFQDVFEKGFKYDSLVKLGLPERLAFILINGGDPIKTTQPLPTVGADVASLAQSVAPEPGKFTTDFLNMAKSVYSEPTTPNPATLRYWVGPDGSVWKGPVNPDDNLHYGRLEGLQGDGSECWVLYRSDPPKLEDGYEEVTFDHALCVMMSQKRLWRAGKLVGPSRMARFQAMESKAMPTPVDIPGAIPMNEPVRRDNGVEPKNKRS